ncbi:Hypothetical protein, putative [Bodo saltans]|uniref:Uncharacterized protein n=1 Tax=Bodo saltans TaxID=75058 RepID=A0A0S4JAN1_BODSA|nr:Hypothetical protein, putative [Bodo saltans]|eukprot:CUG88626.1 Hypothetical protein, putative [Bodo saltans]
MRRRLSAGDADGTEGWHNDNVIPRYLLSTEERLQLSPVLSKQIQDARTSPFKHQVHINHNYQTVTSRYQQAQPLGGVVERGTRGPVTPSRPDEDEPRLALSSTQSPRPQRGSTTSPPPQQPHSARKRSVSPSLAKFPSVQSRYLQDPRLQSSPSRKGDDVARPHSPCAGTRDSGAALSWSPRRSGTPTRQNVIPVPTPTHVQRTPSPFRAGQRAATPEEISRRNKALLLSHSKKKVSVVSSVGLYIHQRSPSRSRTPQQDRAILSPGYVRTSSPDRRAASTSVATTIRGASPDPSHHRLVSPSQSKKKVSVVSSVGLYIHQRSPSRSRTPQQDKAILSPGYVRTSSPDRRAASTSIATTIRGASPDPSHHRLVSPFSRAHSPLPVRRKFVEEEKFIDHWREERAGARVAPGHVPRVAKLSVGYELSRPVSPGPPPMIHWVPQPTPRTTTPTTAAHPEDAKGR